MSATEQSSELTLVTSIYRATNAIVREVDQRLARDHGVTFVQAITLLAINSFDHPQPHLVADYLSQQSQTVTGVLDRLERSGYLRRQRDLKDRRAVRLELTDSGARLVAAVRPALQRSVEEVLGGTTGTLRKRLSDDLAALERATSKTPD